MPVYSQDYYWNKGNKVFVKKTDYKNFYLFYNADKTINDLEIKSTKVFNKNLHWARGNLKDDNSIEYISPAVINSKGDTLSFTNLFYVRLKDKKDINQLKKMAKENNVEILGNNKFMPLWYTLSCSKKSTGNALEMANLFYESKLFSVAEADFLIPFKFGNCVNDSLFSAQWNMRNWGQYINPQHNAALGMDINYCAVRSITTGNPDIIVAVIDQGIQLNHPDLANMHPISYDALTGGSSQERGSHGTWVAGIIGANTNNGRGIAGIAPNSKLMSISILNDDTIPDTRQQFADGINWAWRNGASVINNSWGHHYLLNSNFIDNAISNALDSGRAGKGTVVVFCAGNHLNTNSFVSHSVWYPADSNPNIIAVGAMSPCGERKYYNSTCGYYSHWGSNYGAELDVVAPGSAISTTDRNSLYKQDFWGTSAAAPHVSGVAALILSVNPNLTHQQVKNIIESTARKVGGYNYQTTAGRPNGTWHPEMGYGLIDTYAAVKKAVCMLSPVTVSGTINTDTTVYGSSITTSGTTTVPSGRKLTLTGCSNITITEGFTVESGASLDIRVGP